MYVAIAKYQEAVVARRDAITKLEELRSRVFPLLSEKVVLATDQNGKATNWMSVRVKDKKVKKVFKQFQHQVQRVEALSTEVNAARREMVRLLDQNA